MIQIKNHGLIFQSSYFQVWVFKHWAFRLLIIWNDGFHHIGSKKKGCLYNSITLQRTDYGLHLSWLCFFTLKKHMGYLFSSQFLGY